MPMSGHGVLGLQTDSRQKMADGADLPDAAVGGERLAVRKVVITK